MLPPSLRRYILKPPSSLTKLTGISPFRSPNRHIFRPITTNAFNQSIKHQTHFSTTLATHILSTNFPNSNVVFSPISVHFLLSILAAGSKGPTLDQLLGFLNALTTDELNELCSTIVSLLLLDCGENCGPSLGFANGVWVDQTLSVKPSFKQLMGAFYQADCKQVDFQNKAAEVAKEVNLWAEKQTGGLIKKILPANAVNNVTLLVLANAIYFKGAWLEKFERSETKESEFHLVDGNKAKVPFMTSGKKQFVSQYDGFKVLSLPYLRGEEDKRHFTMCFYLPDTKDGLPSLIEKISSTPNFFDDHIPDKVVEMGKFMIPKFKILSRFEASDALKELKLVSPFTEEASLTEMIDPSAGQNVYASSIQHACFIEVNEEGTKAAAASTVVMIGSSWMIEPKVDFVADHPFLFVIRENVSGAVLFIGQVIDPRDS